MNAMAYHEAGHAAAAIAKGVPLQRLSIVPDSDLGGYSVVGSSGRNHAAVLFTVFAGPAAESIATNRNPLDCVSNSDWDAAAEAGRALGGAKYGPVIADAVAWCRQHWPAIEALAKALEDRQTMHGWAAEQVVTMAWRAANLSWNPIYELHD